MLPTEEVASVAHDIYVAAMGDDDVSLNAACHKWLALKGKREGPSLIGFSFCSKKRLLDIEVLVTARINCQDLIAEASAYVRKPTVSKRYLRRRTRQRWRRSCLLAWSRPSSMSLAS